MNRVIACLLLISLLAPAFSDDEVKSDGGSLGFTNSDRNWWSLVKPKRFPEPTVKLKSWVRNPIDAFILAKLESAGIRPAAAADRVTLIRRLSFDLIGLPPTPGEVEAFVNDKSPRAYENLVERLLASPQYGERWARHWLDLARFAESEGFKSDETRLNAWRYRDCVIKAFNEDKPYDRFIKEQLAGDEIAPHDPWACVATAFNRHYADESNARNLLLRRQDILNDITDTTGAVFLGLTLGCARCHDHKFDPIRTKDYYRLQAFFAAVRARDEIPMLPDQELAEYRAKLTEWQERTKDLRAEMAKLEQKYRDEFVNDMREKFPKEIVEAIDTPPDKRTPLQALMVDKAAPQFEISAKTMAGKMKSEVKTRYEELLKQLEGSRPPVPPLGTGVTDIGTEAPKHYLLTRGVWDARGEEVQPGFLSIFDANPAKLPPPKPGSKTTGRRTALAEWIASPDNPLTARVMVNRLWQHHFGRALTENPSDLGVQGERPTHPELLDWLATEFVRQGWSLKAMHRLIVNSNMYRQSSVECRVTGDEKQTKAIPNSTLVTRHSPLSVDPVNKLLWRFPLRRLEAEAVRDAMLAVSGELNIKMFGPSMFPELPPGISTRAGWPVTSDPKERNRRSVYIFVRRNMRYPLMEVFDGPDTNETCARRSVTTTAPQALTLMNSELVIKYATAFAYRVAKEAGADASKQIERAYQLAFCRVPDADEMRISLDFLNKHAELAKKESASKDDPAHIALVDFCHALFNANEFVYVH